MHIEEPDRRTKNDWKKGRGFGESINEEENEARQNKRDTRERRRYDINLQTKRPEDTSSRHLWLVNCVYGERTSTSPLALGYPLLGPSRHVRAYYCMP